MDKKEFIFPGTILGVVLVIAVGLIITQPKSAVPLPVNDMATSTTATSSAASIGTPAHTTSTTSSAHPVSQGSTAATGVTHYYPYGTTMLELNQVAGFKNAVSIRPVAVIADNRCPVEVYCIQAGTITISLKVSANGESTFNTISLGQTITVSGTRITFGSVTPVRHMAEAPASDSYRFTFIIEPST